MAGPGRPGPPTATIEAQTERDIVRLRVLLLRERGLTQAAVARATGYHPDTVRVVLKKAETETLNHLSGLESRALLLGILEQDFWEAIEPRLHAMAASGKFDKAVFDSALKVVDRFVLLLGLGRLG
jgi:hypothetical protein